MVKTPPFHGGITGSNPVGVIMLKRYYSYNAYIILDEAQNTTPAQMKMFLTRIGFGSKVVITGDATQKDLSPGTKSGLDVAVKVLSKIDDIAFCNLTSKDVVRHPLVQKIVKAYEEYEHKQERAKERRKK